ncbi:hypothetical protein NLG97_g1990 [Lecanicillium saksenae]|uniref:Uncharacterized protein n=1 Tax=Lecanicillium saksenae TaxID=468837 RepID=A0ACC1R294_9HYPO|nr:hypothetical protein NLG97_g1990 [Lecanicillium saksenae]
MFKQITILAVAGLASASTKAAHYATPWASVYNNCKFDVTVFREGATVDAGLSVAAGSVQTWGYPKEGEATNALKITRGPDGLEQHEPQLVFSYSINDGKVAYDLSEVYGDAFKGFKVEASANDENCPKIEWDNGVSPGGANPAASCSAEVAIAVGLCL